MRRLRSVLSLAPSTAIRAVTCAAFKAVRLRRDPGAVASPPASVELAVRHRSLRLLRHSRAAAGPCGVAMRRLRPGVGPSPESTCGVLQSPAHGARSIWRLQLRAVRPLSSLVARSGAPAFGSPARWPSNSVIGTQSAPCMRTLASAMLATEESLDRHSTLSDEYYSLQAGEDADVARPRPPSGSTRPATCRAPAAPRGSRLPHRGRFVQGSHVSSTNPQAASTLMAGQDGSPSVTRRWFMFPSGRCPNSGRTDVGRLTTATATRVRRTVKQTVRFVSL